LKVTGDPLSLDHERRSVEGNFAVSEQRTVSAVVDATEESHGFTWGNGFF
jgi:hypothetical protein